MTHASDPITRRPHCRLGKAAWARIRQLYEQGATAKALSEVFGPTERTIFTHAKKGGWLRKDQPEEAAPLSPEAAEDEAMDITLHPANRPVLELSEEPTLAEAARVSMRVSVRHVKRADPARAYTWARLAGQYERLDRAVGGAAGGEDPTEPGRRAALDFLRARGVDLSTLRDEA